MTKNIILIVQISALLIETSKKSLWLSVNPLKKHAKLQFKIKNSF